MTISGSVEATCKECQCRFGWHLDSFPFVDAKIIGTCDECFDKKSHDCVDEFQIEDGHYAIVGRKEFKKIKIHEDQLRKHLRFHKREMTKHGRINQEFKEKNLVTNKNQQKKMLRHMFIAQYIERLLGE